ncbi:MAG: hypothetical protein ACYC77_11210 [Coriobacteriia bacterium]
MKSRSTIVGVYGPVLLAAMLILTIVPGCAMPSCTGAAVAVAGDCEQPVTSQFKSACELDGEPAPSAPAQPCHDESSDCDATMSHGTPEGVQVANASVPDVSPVVALLDTTDVAVDGYIASTVVYYNAHPPDPLGVRLTV